MSFQNLKVDELKELAEFYAVEPEVADEDHGPTKKELLAALAEDEVSKEDYERFVEAKESGQDKSPEARAAEEAAAEAEEAEEEGDTVEAEAAADDADAVEAAAEQEDPSDEVLVKYERKNPSYQVRGILFTKAHPFASVPEDVAEYLIRELEGFRLALPSEVTEYYS